jgi:hypothetical protein
MNRSLSILVALVVSGSLGISLSSCNTPSCGPGTAQMQQPDGTLKCVATDEMASMIPCDVDGGNTVIVGGKCISAIQCDPTSTVLINGVCVGNGGGTKPMCRTPAPGKACVFGDIHNFTDDKPNAVTPLHVDLFDPVTLLTGGAPIASTILSDGGAYVFQDFAPPGLGLIVVLTGRTDATLVPTATGDSGIAAGNQYRLDAYAVKMADAAGWAASGFDISTGGGYIAKFYKDAKPAPNLLIANETMPAAGVTLLKNNSTDPSTKYFNATLTAIDNALTVTGTSGVAIMSSPIPPNSGFPNFTGMGGGISPWESLPGGSAPGLVFVTRFHPGP